MPSAPVQSVIVDQVHVYGLAALEAEDDTPVPGYTHTPLARSVTLQRVQSKTRRIRATRMRRFLQPEQNPPKPWHEMRW